MRLDKTGEVVAHDKHKEIEAVQRKATAATNETQGKWLRALPFAAGSFDGAVCISALHHVPDIPRTLREIQRVLKDDGSVVFSEPGRSHAVSAQARTEMQELGVLERDVVAEELMVDECIAWFEHLGSIPVLVDLDAGRGYPVVGERGER